MSVAVAPPPTAVAANTRPRGNRGVLPGFRLSLGYTLTYLSLIVLIPLAGLVFRSADLGWTGFWEAVASPRALAAYRLTFGAAFAAAAVNLVFGLVTAWVLARYDFPGKGFIDALVDLPFALPTAVAGISLTALYAENGWLGRFIEPLGLKVAFAPTGVARRDDLRGLAVRRTHRAAGVAGDRHPDGGGRCDARRDPATDGVPGDLARHHRTGADRAGAGVRARCW
jgi:sulfate transport system permease protein